MMNRSNPSWKIDELSRRVLEAAKWPSAVSTNSQNPTPHFDELERALEIYLPPLALPNNTQHASGNSVKTCTVPSGLARQNDNNEESKREIWTWTPQAQNIENCYTKHQDNDIAAASDGTTLEDMAPFSPDFYRAMGELAKEAFQPGSVKDLQMDEKGNNSSTTAATSNNETFSTAGISNIGGGSNRDTANKKALLSLEQYSLRRMHDAFRITRILLSMQELHVGSNEEDKFITNLLHYCEGMHISATKQQTCSDVTSSNERSQTVKHNRGKRIPILSALFHHWSRLPALENAIQQLSRRYSALLPVTADEFWELYSDSSSDCSGTTGGAASFLGARALKIESFKKRLEEELQCHVNGDSGSDDRRGKLSQDASEEAGLVALLAVLYESSDATLRGKCRRWIGQWLRSFALGSGSSLSHSAIRGIGEEDDGLGPSFVSFCPLFVSSSLGMTNSSSSRGMAPGVAGMGPISITHAGGSGGGLPQNHLGMQNTSGCGIDALLHVLLRIVSGFVYLPSNGSSKSKGSGTRSKILLASHESLLFDCLIPLHRPSGMVLWRDQTPLIGLYHEAMVKCIGELVSADRTLIGPVIGALLHPDVWPTEGSKSSTSSGRGSGANTPKLVLLLHEVDTLVGLLRKKDDTEDQIESNLSSFDAYFHSLVSRLCLCISSDNSRISEQSLQMFRNEIFSVMVRRRLKEVGPQFIRALCRCSTNNVEGFDISWNPTVRKMTHLVLSQLEEYYNNLDSNDNETNLFSIACEEAVSGTTFVSDEMQLDKKASGSGTAILDSRPSGGITSSLGTDMTSLRGAMGNWRPPPRKKQGVFQVGTKTQPPTTITGVAPWASGSQNGGREPASKKQPPVTVTGVAPWAIKNGHSRSTPLPARPFGTSLPRPPAKKHINSSVGKPIVSAADGSAKVQVQAKEPSLNAVSRVRSYMTQLKPAGDIDSSADGVSAWAKAQMEESPVILQTLKFHDLVFGQG